MCVYFIYTYFLYIYKITLTLFSCTKPLLKRMPQCIIQKAQLKLVSRDFVCSTVKTHFLGRIFCASFYFCLCEKNCKAVTYSYVGRGGYCYRWQNNICLFIWDVSSLPPSMYSLNILYKQRLQNQ